ncbi:MAG: methionyl-tRNA formyltransferase [Elusimicrobiaceae bacterium]|nr:methionyl-tRNA formyltransferase [Elusimicrobiaceae bacterium]
MKTVFLGTPEPAVPFLHKTREMTDLRLVVTNSDKPCGRGMKISPSPVKNAALAAGLPVLAPCDIEEAREAVAAVAPDLGIVVACGHFLKPQFLATARHGYINIHFSLLPKYRGAAPVQWSLINGETETGVTAFWITKGMDTGDIFMSRKLDILPSDDAASLMRRLTALGADVLADTLNAVKSGRLIRKPQAGEPTFARMLAREDAWLDFRYSAAVVHNRIRGLALGPKAKALLRLPDGRRIAVQFVKTVVCLRPGRAGLEPGAIVRVETERGIIVQCKENTELGVLEVRPEGRNTVPARDFFSGMKLGPGDIFLSGAQRAV